MEVVCYMSWRTSEQMNRSWLLSTSPYKMPGHFFSQTTWVHDDKRGLIQCNLHQMNSHAGSFSHSWQSGTVASVVQATWPYLFAGYGHPHMGCAFFSPLAFSASIILPSKNQSPLSLSHTHTQTQLAPCVTYGLSTTSKSKAQIPLWSVVSALWSVVSALWCLVCCCHGAHRCIGPCLNNRGQPTTELSLWLWDSPRSSCLSRTWHLISLPRSCLWSPPFWPQEGKGQWALLMMVKSV
jgi:hypothetical protein